jgi:hypothetical protein
VRLSSAPLCVESLASVTGRSAAPGRRVSGFGVQPIIRALHRVSNEEPGEGMLWGHASLCRAPLGRSAAFLMRSACL